MKEEHFEVFTHNLSYLQKCVKALEAKEASRFNIKGVHVAWLYALRKHPEGLTAAELAAKSGINRSLVSREIDVLYRESLIDFGGTLKSSSYYSRKIVLSEKGATLAAVLAAAAMNVQTKAGEGISDEDLAVFYRVLGQLSNNFAKMINEIKSGKKGV